jgi:HEAT repeat protein
MADVRGACAEALGRVGGDRSRNVILDVFRNERHSDEVTVACASALGRIGGTEARDALVYFLQSHESPRVRETCATALGEIGDRNSTIVLSSILRGDGDENTSLSIRAVCAESLGRIGDSTAHEVLFECVENPTIPERLQGHCASAIAQSRDPKARKKLIETILSGHTAEWILAGCTGLLAGVSANQELPEFGDITLVEKRPMDVENIIALTFAKSTFFDTVQIPRALALAQLGDKSAQRYLLEDSEKDVPELQELVVLALCQMGNVASREEIRRIVDDQDSPFAPEANDLLMIMSRQTGWRALRRGGWESP